MSIRVFVVDDSAVVRQTLQHLLQGEPEIELIGSAPNPLIAAPMLRKSRPDVLLLDIEMPGMDGLTFLRQLMAEAPIPIVICSTLTEAGSKMALDALSAGAVAVVAKPRLGLKQFLEDSRRELVQTLRAASRSKPRLPGNAVNTAARGSAPSAAKPAAAAAGGLHALSVNKPVVLGSSTGGTQAIEAVLTALPADAPGIAIVQHMPEKFTAMYAQRLDQHCAMRVREARDGDRLERGLVLIAPGGRHMQMRKAGGQYFMTVADGPPVNRHKPSVDVLFRSAAECAGKDTLAIILTGMGDDGARGMKALHDRGARTVAQSEETCIVFGMPKEAIAAGAVDEVLPLPQVARAILEFDRRA
ncbi:MAG: chemotaxis response regulator protein-glutamate methylesterase [Burkholderiales bacterium]|nr:chemotaxis response regulator protein-glutamate methylesterase [Burkholderiales bacterium]